MIFYYVRNGRVITNEEADNLNLSVADDGLVYSGTQHRPDIDWEPELTND